jgi:hypothetical protein
MTLIYLSYFEVSFLSFDKKTKENSARKATECHNQQDPNTDAEKLITFTVIWA